MEGGRRRRRGREVYIKSEVQDPPDGAQLRVRRRWIGDIEDGERGKEGRMR